MSMTGIEAISAERKRQVEEEGWTPEHDRQHKSGELALAAACYAIPPLFRKTWDAVEKLWCWHYNWWKPTPKDRKREIVKAGALLAAEYDRLVAEEAQP